MLNYLKPPIPTAWGTCMTLSRLTSLTLAYIGYIDGREKINPFSSRKESDSIGILHNKRVINVTCYIWQCYMYKTEEAVDLYHICIWRISCICGHMWAYVGIYTFGNSNTVILMFQTIGPEFKILKSTKTPLKKDRS